MSNQTDNLKSQLISFGLNTDEIDIYLALLKKSPQSALDLSRALNIGRTKVYRLTDLLNEKGLVNILVDEYGNKFEANSPRQLEVLLHKKESEIEKLKAESGILFEELEKLKPSTFGRTKINYYKGIEGLKQITWNSLKASDGIRIYEIFNMEGFLDKEFSEKIRFELLSRKIFIKQLTNLEYNKPFTIYKDLIKNFWEYKHISPQKLEIKTECLIYNDVYCMYSYEEGEIFGVEIHNQRLANMQKQIFDIIFSTAVPMTIINDQGEAKLIN